MRVLGFTEERPLSQWEDCPGIQNWTMVKLAGEWNSRLKLKSQALLNVNDMNQNLCLGLLRQIKCHGPYLCCNHV